MKHGFGLLAMLGFCCFLGLCLLTSTFYFHQLTGEKINFTIFKENSTTNSYRMKNDYSGVSNLYVSYQEYRNLELQLKQAAELYVKNNSMLKWHKVIITLGTLYQQKIIDTLYDSNGHSCHGYVVYDSTSNQFIPYLRCGSYRSADYINRLE